MREQELQAMARKLLPESYTDNWQEKQSIWVAGAQWSDENSEAEDLKYKISELKDEVYDREDDTDDLEDTIKELREEVDTLKEELSHYDIRDREDK